MELDLCAHDFRASLVRGCVACESLVLRDTAVLEPRGEPGSLRLVAFLPALRSLVVCDLALDFLSPAYFVPQFLELLPVSLEELHVATRSERRVDGVVPALVAALPHLHRLSLQGLRTDTWRDLSRLRLRTLEIDAPLEQSPTDAVAELVRVRGLRRLAVHGLRWDVGAASTLVLAHPWLEVLCLHRTLLAAGVLVLLQQLPRAQICVSRDPTHQALGPAIVRHRRRDVDAYLQ